MELKAQKLCLAPQLGRCVEAGPLEGVLIPQQVTELPLPVDLLDEKTGNLLELGFIFTL